MNIKLHYAIMAPLLRRVGDTARLARYKNYLKRDREKARSAAASARGAEY